MQALRAPGSSRGPGTKETKRSPDDPATETDPLNVDALLCSNPEVVQSGTPHHSGVGEPLEGRWLGRQSCRL